MSLSLLLLLLLLLLVCSSQATHFYGTVMTYYPKTSSTDGSVTVVFRYKLNFVGASTDSWDCVSGNCGTQRTLTLNAVDAEGSGEWRQTEGIMTRDVPGSAPFQLALSGGNWITNIKNGVRQWRAVTLVDLRSRSDTGQANTSPQTTIVPAVRVPSNCQRDFDLLAFDPDGDEVKCRFGNTSLTECNPCTPPSVTNLSPSCTLSFSSNSSSDQGPYAVQLVMEDFPRRTITLNQTNGELTTVTTQDAISKIPIQFVLRVDSAVPSCTEGLYLPRFLPPTPGNRARLYAPVNQSLEISISAEANVSTVSELLFSGPHNVNQTTAAAAGQYVLRWTPSQDEDGESHPFCFVAQAVYNSAKYHSDLRCVIVTVGPDPTTTVTTPTTQTTAPSTRTAPTMTTTITTPTTQTTAPSTTTAPTMTTTITTPTTQTTAPSTTTAPIMTTTITTPTTQTTAPSTTTTVLTSTISTTPITATTATSPTAQTPSTVEGFLSTTQTTTSNETMPALTTITTTTTLTTTPQSTTTVPSTTTTLTAPTARPAPVTTPDNTAASLTPVVDTTNQFVLGLSTIISSSSPLSEDNIQNILIQLKDELVRRGLPADTTLRLVSYTTTTSPPGG